MTVLIISSIIRNDHHASGTKCNPINSENLNLQALLVGGVGDPDMVDLNFGSLWFVVLQKFRETDNVRCAVQPANIRAQKLRAGSSTPSELTGPLIVMLVSYDVNYPRVTAGA